MSGEFAANAALKIRPARAEDCETIISLIKGLAEYENAPNDVLNTAEQLRKDGWGETPRFICWIAEVDECTVGELSAVGFALCYYSYSTWTGTCLFLEDLYVIPSKRRLGIGMSLIRTCIEHAYSLGLARVQWAALDWNENALAFYESIGAIQTKEWIPIRMTRPVIADFIQKYSLAKESVSSTEIR